MCTLIDAEELVGRRMSTWRVWAVPAGDGKGVDPADRPFVAHRHGAAAERRVGVRRRDIENVRAHGVVTASAALQGAVEPGEAPCPRGTAFNVPVAVPRW